MDFGEAKRIAGTSCWVNPAFQLPVLFPEKEDQLQSVMLSLFETPEESKLSCEVLIFIKP